MHLNHRNKIQDEKKQQQGDFIVFCNVKIENGKNRKLYK